MDKFRILPTDVSPEKGAKRMRLEVPTLRITRKSRSSAKSADDRTTAYNVNSVDRLIEAFEERERSLGESFR